MEEQGKGSLDHGGITVIDRRKFNVDGSLREGAESDTPAEEARTENPQPVSPKEQGTPESSSEKQGMSESPSEKQEMSESPSEKQGTPESSSEKQTTADAARATPLLSLLISLATSAQIALGDVESPTGRGRYVNLEEAQGYIDMLEDLRRKTEGRLTSEEGRLLRSALYELQMRYVARQQELLAPGT